MNFNYRINLEIPVRVEVENYHPGSPQTPDSPGDSPEWDDYRILLGRLDITDYLPQSVLNSIIDEIPEQAAEEEYDMMINDAESRRDR